MALVNKHGLQRITTAQSSVLSGCVCPAAEQQAWAARTNRKAALMQTTYCIQQPFRVSRESPRCVLLSLKVINGRISTANPTCEARVVHRTATSSQNIAAARPIALPAPLRLSPMAGAVKPAVNFQKTAELPAKSVPGESPLDQQFRRGDNSMLPICGSREPGSRAPAHVRPCKCTA